MCPTLDLFLGGARASQLVTECFQVRILSKKVGIDT